MLNTVVKPPQQLPKGGVIAHQHLTNQPCTISSAMLHQLIEQQTYLRNINFVWCCAGHIWQTKPEPQLSMYRQFIRLTGLQNGHMILAESVQLSAFSLSAMTNPINQDYWINVRSGVIQ
jgi:hypothetical protein